MEIDVSFFGVGCQLFKYGTVAALPRTGEKIVFAGAEDDPLGGEIYEVVDVYHGPDIKGEDQVTGAHVTVWVRHLGREMPIQNAMHEKEGNR